MFSTDPEKRTKEAKRVERNLRVAWQKHAHLFTDSKQEMVHLLRTTLDSGEWTSDFQKNVENLLEREYSYRLGWKDEDDARIAKELVSIEAGGLFTLACASIKAGDLPKAVKLSNKLTKLWRTVNGVNIPSLYIRDGSPTMVEEKYAIPLFLEVTTFVVEVTIRLRKAPPRLVPPLPVMFTTPPPQLPIPLTVYDVQKSGALVLNKKRHRRRTIDIENNITMIMAWKGAFKPYQDRRDYKREIEMLRDTELGARLKAFYEMLIAMAEASTFHTLSEAMKHDVRPLSEREKLLEKKDFDSMEPSV